MGRERRVGSQIPVPSQARPSRGIELDRGEMRSSLKQTRESVTDTYDSPEARLHTMIA